MLGMNRNTGLWMALLGCGSCGGAKSEAPGSGTSSTPSADERPVEALPSGAEPPVVDPPDGPYLDDSLDSSPPELDAEPLGRAIEAALADARTVHGGPAVAADIW